MQSVSIIIPTHNRGDLLMQTVASVRAQTMGDFEAMIVDDHSTDDTQTQLAPILNDDPRFRLINVPDKRSGAQAARNIGIEQSTGDYIILLDSDDLLAPHCLEQRIAFMRDHPQLDFAVTPCECFLSAPGDLKLLWNIETKTRDLDRFLAVDVPWQTTSPIWRRAAIEKLLPWPEDVPVAQDWDFHIRALLAGLNYARFGTTDHYWRRPAADRESIGKNATNPKLLRARVGVNVRVVKLLTNAHQLTEPNRLAMAGLFWQSAERIAKRVSRKEARDVWHRAYDLGLINIKQMKQGTRYLALSRFGFLQNPLRHRLTKAWPKPFFVSKSTTYLNSPVTPHTEAA